MNDVQQNEKDLKALEFRLKLLIVRRKLKAWVAQEAEDRLKESTEASEAKPAKKTDESDYVNVEAVFVCAAIMFFVTLVVCETIRNFAK